MVCIQEGHAKKSDRVVLEQWAHALGMVVFVNEPRSLTGTTLGGIILVKKIFQF